MIDLSAMEAMRNPPDENMGNAETRTRTSRSVLHPHNPRDAERYYLQPGVVATPLVPGLGPHGIAHGQHSCLETERSRDVRLYLDHSLPLKLFFQCVDSYNEPAEEGIGDPDSAVRPTPRF